MHQRRDGAWENPATIRVDQDTSIPGLVFDRARRDGGQIIAERRVSGSVQRVSAQAMVDFVRDLARGLLALGVQRGTRVGILASTSYEWAAFDLAALSLGAVTVPIYETDSAAQIAHILADAHVELVVTQKAQQADLVDSVRPPCLRHVFSLDRGGEQQVVTAGLDTPAARVDELCDQITLDDVATIVYTSGTTGVAKGVILTHGNFVGPALQAYDLLPRLINDKYSRTLLFLPVAHVLARFVMYCILFGEGRLCFSPDVRHLVDDIQTFRPTMMLVVPRVLEKVYNTASQRAGSGVKRKLFSWAALQARKVSEATAYPRGDVKGQNRKRPSHLQTTKRTSPGASLRLNILHRVADALVLRHVRSILGPSLHTVICGGAPLPLDIAHFYRGLGLTVLQGYGLSETTGPVSVQIPTDFPPDSVGYLWPGNAGRLADDGELLLQGLSIASGYLGLPEATASAFQDGWLRTGDLAQFDSEGRLRITGRKKELIVTAGGKNVSPEILQDSLAAHPLISQVVVVGDGRPYIGALITLDTEMLPLWLANKGCRNAPVHRALELPEVRSSLSRAIARANAKVSRAESIRRFLIVNKEFSVESGYLTPSLKLKRQKVLADLASDVDRLYELPDTDLAKVGGSLH